MLICYVLKHACICKDRMYYGQTDSVMSHSIIYYLPTVAVNKTSIPNGGSVCFNDIYIYIFFYPLKKIQQKNIFCKINHHNCGLGGAPYTAELICKISNFTPFSPQRIVVWKWKDGKNSKLKVPLFHIVGVHAENPSFWLQGLRISLKLKFKSCQGMKIMLLFHSISLRLLMFVNTSRLSSLPVYRFTRNPTGNGDFLHILGPPGTQHLDEVLMLLCGYGAMLRLDLCLVLT